MNLTNDNLVLRPIKLTDCPIISQSFEKQGWNKPVAQYEEYYEMQERGDRDIIIATVGETFAGYVTINWLSEYNSFTEQGIPEIVDFNVLKKVHRNGIGTAIMDEAERRIKMVSGYSGLGVGVISDYGPAHILYSKRGYIPDGKGLTINSRSLKYGDVVSVDDSLVMYMVKKL